MELSGKVAIFLLRFITHGWPDEQLLEILKHLRAAASPATKLLIVDPIVPYTCPILEPSSTPGGAIPGGILPPPPSPLVNLGQANTTVYFADIEMFNIFGAQERTIGEFVALAGEAGWMIVKVYRPTGSELQQIECECI